MTILSWRPVNMHGLRACQVLAALRHEVCTLHTSSKESDGAWVEGSFLADNNGVQASTTAFLTAMEHTPSVWLNITERGLRLVLTWQTPGERLLASFGHAADGKVDPDSLVVPDGGNPMRGAFFMQSERRGHAV